MTNVAREDTNDEASPCPDTGVGEAVRETEDVSFEELLNLAEAGKLGTRTRYRVQ